MTDPASPDRQHSTRFTEPVTGSRRSIAVSPHVLASRAGAEVMDGGGNAVDGAIAVNAVLGVVIPDTCGPGGDLFALVHRPGQGAPRTLNSSGRAGSGATAEKLRALGMTTIPDVSHWTITVPGCVDGWQELSRAEGRLPLADVLSPAIDIATNGFEASVELVGTLTRMEPILSVQGSGPPLYPGGHPPRAGDILRRPDLAETLAAVAEEGREAFYRGLAGREITAVTEGAVTDDDLAVNNAEWVDPVRAELFGRTAWTIPPNSQGYLTLATLSVFEALDPGEDPSDPRFQHLLIEAYRSVAWERADVVADPRFAPLAPQELVEPSRLAIRAAAISPDQVTLWEPDPGGPGGTAYMCTVDSEGMGVSLIQSNFYGIGTGLSAGATGVFLHNRGAGFNLRPGHANELAPGKRPLHTLSPTLWTRDGQLDLVLGTRGGHFQPQFLAQVAARYMAADVSLPSAVSDPRWAVGTGEGGGTHRVHLEPPFGRAMAAALRGKGHEAELTEARQPGWGPVSAIGISDGTVTAVADDRVSTAAVAAA